MTTTVIFRTGGLGDFLLALPLLEQLRDRPERVVLATRSEYWDLVSSLYGDVAFFDADGLGMAQLLGGQKALNEDLLRADRWLSYQTDNDGSMKRAALRLGVKELKILPSKPLGPKHAVEAACTVAGVRLPPGWKSRAYLQALRRPVNSGLLWLHPGSGGTLKNCHVPWLRKKAEEWLSEGRDIRQISVSFGEADTDIHRIYGTIFAGVPRCTVLQRPLLSELAAQLGRAASYIGPDTGVTHLAAMMGVPTEAVFITTKPEIWGPMGPEVTITRQPIPW